MITAFILFGMAVLLYLLAAGQRTPAPHSDNSADIAALIARHEAQPFENEEERAEQEYHLYHALAKLRGSVQSRNRLPLWIWVCVPLLPAASAWLWYVPLGGHFAERQLELTDKLAPAVTRSLHLGDLPQNIDEQAMHTYCHILQAQVDREDPEQLDTLGQCHLQYGNHAAATDVYRRLRHLQPQNDHAALQYAQASLFANPDQAMSAEIEAILSRLYRDNPQDTLTGILLATAYTRAGAHDKALPVWQQLKADTRPEHPLYPLIENTAAQMADPSVQAAPAAAESTAQPRTLTVIIPPALLAGLPDGAQLFASLTPKDSNMPLAVQKLPPKERQTITFRAQDSMTGADYLGRDDLTVRLFISSDGSVNGTRFGEIRQDYPPGTSPDITLPAP